MAKEAYSKNTQRAQSADGAMFQGFCEKEGLEFFPTSRASEPVRLTLKDMGLGTEARQRQALGLGWKEIKEFIESAGDGPRADRERALLSVAYDTMARRSELAARNLEDLTFMPNGSGTALIRRSKTDQGGQVATGYLSRETVRWLRDWFRSSGIRGGSIFRRLVGQHRIGAAQGLLALNIDLASVMQAGRWKSISKLNAASIDSQERTISGWANRARFVKWPNGYFCNFVAIDGYCGLGAARHFGQMIVGS